MEQNAIVGVFLRLLEYYRGVLFLTTNRATIVDDAIRSRCMAHVRYTVPTDDDARRRIWKILSKQFGTKIKDVTIEKLIRHFPNLSGRSIKQLIKLSKVVSNRRKCPITLELVKFVARFQDMEGEANDVSQQRMDRSRSGRMPRKVRTLDFS